MKTASFLALALLAIVGTVAVPSLVDRSGDEGRYPAPKGVLLGEAASAGPCTIRVEPGLDTHVDHGPLGALTATRTFEGGFRYWEEPVGQVLYVYDDVQNLVGRIVNPRSVRLLDATTN